MHTIKSLLSRHLGLDRKSLTTRFKNLLCGALVACAAGGAPTITPNAQAANTGEIPMISYVAPVNSLITLSWDSASEADAYVVYAGTASGNYGIATKVGNVTTVDLGIDNVYLGKTNYFVVTAISSDWLESLPSNEVSSEVGVIVPPLGTGTNFVTSPTISSPATSTNSVSGGVINNAVVVYFTPINATNSNMVTVKYLILSQKDGNISFNVATAVAADASSGVITGLLPDTRYNLAVTTISSNVVTHTVYSSSPTDAGSILTDPPQPSAAPYGLSFLNFTPQTNGPNAGKQGSTQVMWTHPYSGQPGFAFNVKTGNNINNLTNLVTTADTLVPMSFALGTTNIVSITPKQTTSLHIIDGTNTVNSFFIPALLGGINTSNNWGIPARP